MGKRRRAERKAKRKERRANRKLKRADRKEKRGNTQAAERLRKRAAELKEKAKTIKSQIQHQVIRGLTGSVSSINSLGNTTVTASWNYLPEELQQYEELLITLSPASPIRSQLRWNQMATTSTTSTSHTFELGKNLRYTIKLFGVKNGINKLLDRAAVRKNR